ncbi:MAG: 5,6-dimethylbenzimidazole synthase, partial [Sulfuricurvum sp.]|nr:5,6-dimethylbenzimidazole synthase [Sulfuricurvum sp.]
MKAFDAHARTILHSILFSRRDVRGHHFLPDPIEEKALQEILEAAISAPSVG